MPTIDLKIQSLIGMIESSAQTTASSMQAGHPEMIKQGLAIMLIAVADAAEYFGWTVQEIDQLAKASADQMMADPIAYLRDSLAKIMQMHQ
jgi:hypothetical protein